MASVTPLISQEEKDFQAKRWEGVHRPYTAEDVDRARGSIKIDYTLANLGARRLWDLITTEDYVNALGALTGGQAMQMVRAGLKAIYCSGWQVAAAANSGGEVYPDQSLYSVNSVPTVVRNINNAFRRADQIAYAEGNELGFPFAPIIADAEAGFGGVLNSYELARNLIEAGAAGVHFEDQLASAKKCGHLGGRFLYLSVMLSAILTPLVLLLTLLGLTLWSLLGQMPNPPNSFPQTQTYETVSGSRG